MSRIRVVVADDHPIAREGLRTLLEKTHDIEVVAEASDGAEALTMVAQYAPDILVLDMEMPGLKGVEVAQQLQANGSDVRILALSAYEDDQYIKDTLASGAAGYLVKGEIPQRIVEAIRGVAQGQQGWVSRQIAAQMMTWTQTEETGAALLTRREHQVLELVVQGKTNQEIGLALGVSDKTVEKHLDSIFTKLHVSSRVEAAVWAVREGLF